MEKELFRGGLVQESDQGLHLIGKKCIKCGNIQFPSGSLCTQCFSTESTTVTMGQKGKLFSFTTTYGPVAKRKPPFAVGYVELPEGARIFAPLRMEEGRPFEIGMNMELEISDLWEEDGVIKIGYCYKIAD